MTNPVPPPVLRALDQAINEALMKISGRLCILRIEEEALDDAILPPEFAIARREADAQRRAWTEQWGTVVAPALVGAGLEADRIDLMHRSIMRALDGVCEERTWVAAERSHV